MIEQFGLRGDVIEKIRVVLSQFKPIKIAWLYGSRAKGNYKPGSDIDLALTTAGELPGSFVLHVSMALDDLDLPWTFDISLLQSIDNDNLLAHIKRVGVEFYNAETFADERVRQEKN